MAHLFAAGLNSLFGTVTAAVKSPKKFAEGWNSSISWLPLEEGFQVAKQEKKIMIAVIQQEDCPACNYLKKSFRSGGQLQKLSKEFVMVNVSVEEVQNMRNFMPDGNYVPRILFFDSDGKLMPSIKREPALRTWRYNYASDHQLVDIMKKVLENPSKYVSKN